MEAWKDNHYRLVVWFKHFNGKAGRFALFREIQSGQRYLVDARIQDGQTTILMDYMAVLGLDDISVSSLVCVPMSPSIYKPYLPGSIRQRVSL